jgi:integrase
VSVRFGAEPASIADGLGMPRPKTGTLTQLGPALWRLQVTPNADRGTGAKPGAKPRISRSFRGTKAEARAALSRLIVEVGCDLHGGSTATVAELLEQFMATASLANTTRADWESVVANQLLPALGEVPLWRLTARDCDAFYTALKADGLGPSRVRCAHVVLHRAVAQAVRWGWVTHNVVSDATRPEVPRSIIRPPDPASLRLLLAHAEAADPTMACWLQVAVATGARRGEVCALRWDDVDFEARSVRIERSVSATRLGVTVKTTKTAGVRRVSITSQALDALISHRDRAADIARRNGRSVTSSDYIFTSDPTAASPWRPELASRRWERLRDRAGLPHVRLHDLRHFVATELLTAGIDVRTVANRLGHARTSTTMDIYWAFVPARDRDAANHLEEVLRPC